MKLFPFLILYFLSFSCTSVSQERRDSATVTSVNTALPHRLSLLFVGDLMQHQGQIDAARVSGGYDYSDCLKYVKDDISKADIAIGNLEVTFGGKPYKGYPAFSAPDEYLKAIQDAGFDVMITANNHCLDRGKKGLERTILMLDSLKIPHAGTYINKEEREKQYPLLLEKNGFRIALLNYTYGTNGIQVVPPHIVNYIDTAIIAQDIRTSNALHPDAIIACMHWGEEYKPLPNKKQEFLANWLLKKGVTHIIGSHPHVVQPMELRQDSLTGTKHLVAYSLGNFISNMSALRTDGGLMVKLELEKDSTTTRVSTCGYSLVFVARPILTGKKNHILYPVNQTDSLLPKYARTKMDIFTKDARALFQKHNKGINEE